MRVALFTETFLPKWDGIANTLGYLLEHLAERGHKSLLFAPQGGPRRYARTPIVGVPSFRFPLYPGLKLPAPMAMLRKPLERFQPDLIHLVGPASLGLSGLAFARGMNLPVVASYHTDIPGYAANYGMPFMREPLWAYLRWIHNQANLTVAPSRFTRNQLESHGFERVQIWGRGVDSERFHPRHRDPDMRRRLGGRPDEQLLLYVGRLAPEKRVDWLRGLLEKLPGTRLAIVGDGPAREELEKLFAGTPTVFAGYLRGDELARAYASADLFTFPSPSETLGNVVLEAMASGLPVIAPHAGGPIDHVRQDENGYLFRPDEPADMLRHSWRTLYTPGKLERLSAGARAYAETQSWPAVLDGLMERYESLTEEKKAAALMAG